MLRVCTQGRQVIRVTVQVYLCISSFASLQFFFETISFQCWAQIVNASIVCFIVDKKEESMFHYGGKRCVHQNIYYGYMFTEFCFVRQLVVMKHNTPQFSNYRSCCLTCLFYSCVGYICTSFDPQSAVMRLAHPPLELGQSVCHTDTNGKLYAVCLGFDSWAKPQDSNFL